MPKDQLVSRQYKKKEKDNDIMNSWVHNIIINLSLNQWNKTIYQSVANLCHFAHNSRPKTVSTKSILAMTMPITSILNQSVQQWFQTDVQ